ncbi:MAG TPA: DUF177 domain-containing protein [Dehalococcoidia bacterium]|nr:DUF177 domain-containing protein [Dehalococcoidia bacterium]
MLQINVSQQLRDPIGAVREYDVNDIVDIAGTEGRAEGKVTLTRTDRGILVYSVIRMEIELTCSRCLSLCSYPLTLRVAEEYFPTIDIMTSAPMTVPDESGCFTIDEHHIIDLTEAIRQYTVLATPMKPLCHENCAGLCPICGHNLNEGECGCPPPDADPRWAALRKLTVSSDDS